MEVRKSAKITGNQKTQDTKNSAREKCTSTIVGMQTITRLENQRNAHGLPCSVSDSTPPAAEICARRPPQPSHQCHRRCDAASHHQLLGSSSESLSGSSLSTVREPQSKVSAGARVSQRQRRPTRTHAPAAATRPPCWDRAVPMRDESSKRVRWCWRRNHRATRVQ